MTDPAHGKALVFGASGTLGQVVCERLEHDGVQVIRASRTPIQDDGWISLSDEGWTSSLARASIGRVVWAQGANAAGSILATGLGQMRDLFEANVIFVAETLRQLLDREALAPWARLVIVSSVWQRIARDNKLAYVTSKSALAGLVRSLVADLGDMGISINAVLPGVIDSPMTRQFLTAKQIDRLERETPGGRLVLAEQVAAVCSWLGSPSSGGVNGQFITVDGGWSDLRYV